MAERDEEPQHLPPFVLRPRTLSPAHVDDSVANGTAGSSTALTLQDRVRTAINDLKTVDSSDVPVDETCPICIMPFSEIIALEEKFSEEQKGEQGRLGLTKIEGCGHVFCMKDLIEWITNLHGNCPTCRHVFLDIRPPSESEADSSDGGEYIPDDDDDDEEDAFFDTDGFSDVDAEFDVGEMDVELDEDWEGDAERSFGADDSMADIDAWGSSTDGTLSEEAPEVELDSAGPNVDISIADADDTLYEDQADAPAQEESK